MYVGLKAKRDDSSKKVIARLREQLSRLPGLRVYLVAMQDVRVGGRESRSNYQFTLWSSDAEELDAWGVKALEAAKAAPQLVDVSSDREKEGLQARVVIDRAAAARMGVNIAAIDNVLSNAFSQRQISTIYGERNQYKVVLEVMQSRQRDPNDLSGLYAPGAGGVAERRGQRRQRHAAREAGGRPTHGPVLVRAIGEVAAHDDGDLAVLEL
jgi:multidrug efflux pump